MSSSKLRAFLAVVTLFSCHLMAAQDALLWRISGNGLKKASYLFGTMHILCNPEELNKPSLNNCMDSCEVVAMELNLYDYDTRVALIKSQMATAKTSVSSHLTPAQKNRIDSICQLLLGDSLKVFDMKPPVQLLTFLYASPSIIGCSEPGASDMFIAELAHNKGIELFGLETFGFQDSLMGSITYAMQLQALIDFCNNTDSARNALQAMQKLYLKQKLAELYAGFLKNSPDIGENKKEFLDDRNEKWLQFLKDNMTETSIFMAVGAAHLADVNGLIEGLRRAGYTLTPIIIK